MARVRINPMCKPEREAWSCLTEDVFDGPVAVGEVVEVFGGDRHGLGMVTRVDVEHQLCTLQIMWTDSVTDIDAVLRKLRNGLDG